MPNAPARVAVIGGGYAGMSAAVELCGAGVIPTVFEASGTLGGRARRVESDGYALDNGLHILIGAYRETLGMIRRVAPAEPLPLLRRPLELEIHRQFHLRAGALPAPLNVLQGLMTATGLTAGDKWAIARMMMALRLRRYHVERDLPLAEFLVRQRQTARARRLLWEPLCVAALNTLPADASTRTFANVLRDTFAAPADNCDLLLPTVDFSRLFPEPAATHIQQHHGEVRTGQRVLGLHGTAEGVQLSLRQGPEMFDAAIIAVAPQHLAGLTQDEPGLANAVAQVNEFTYRPIHSIYLWYPDNVRLPAPMLGFDARYLQWVFDRGQLGGPQGLLGVVISANGAHEDLPHPALAQAVHAELALAFPHLPAPRWHKVIAERRATIAATVNLARPRAQTGCARIFLAGDYVETGYPATLETAVRSGIAAAALAVHKLANATLT